ncbi:MAG: zinc ribbon domain-containing protein [Candidatus Aminicenantes bacterium]|nr:zinc ribbon domain-containing protein [Candidatus Aminicenantes bacterium]
MAITRCPYCRAIIDEKDKFCTNCGTQLLYAEDAEVEEDIPGEKITHADVEEKDYTIPEPEGEESGDVIIRDEEPEGTAFLEGGEVTAEEEPAAGKEDEGESEEEGREEAAEESEEEGVLAEEPAETTAEGREFRELGSVLLADEAKEEEEESEEAKPKPVKRGPRAERPRGPRQKTLGFDAVEKPADREPFLFSPRPQDAEPVKTGAAPAEEEAAAPASDREEREEQEPETQAQPPAESEAVPPPSGRKDMTFDTEELNRIGPTVDLAHRQVEEFLKVLKEEEEGPAPRPAVPPPPTESKDTRTFDTGLPPWVKEMRKASADERAEPLGGSEEEEAEEDELRAEEEEEAERIFAAAQSEDVSRTDSGIGLPEKTQTRLPFGTPATAEAIEGEPFAARRAYEFEKAPAEPRAAAPRPPFHLGNFLKAKAFDVLFLVAVWLVCLWLAAGRLNGTIFELFNVASGALFAFGGILLVLYFFLFQFFLGETLGDRLFREWDEEEAGD